MIRRLAPAVLAPAVAFVVAVPALAWAQESVPSASGLGDGISGIGGGVLVVGVEKILRYLSERDAKLQAKADETRSEAAKASVLRDIERLRELHNAMSEKVGRLDERMTTHAKQAEQLHDDIGGLRSVLGDIRDRLPRQST